ncbi:hypothetical protein CYY_007698 [Polysphondylium violaceum]|uniref:TPR repeat-containing protein n=1 Tax=Polysphondylium violaceum TaxID=133409 RepID=A0A8J4V205_9MYCE|nr:hypothetical protein CYY_007698 [Polysphondylium violaceum]
MKASSLFNFRNISRCRLLSLYNNNSLKSHTPLSLLSQNKSSLPINNLSNFQYRYRYFSTATNGINNSSNDYNSLIKSSKSLADKEDYQHCLNTLDQAIQLNSSDPKAYIFKGDLYLLLRDINQSVQCYSKALELSPSSHDCLFSLGKCYSILQQYDKAIEYFQQALSINQKDISTLQWIGDSYLEDYVLSYTNSNDNNREKVDKALFYYTKVLELDSTNTKALLGVASTMSDPNMAIPIFHQIIEMKNTVSANSNSNNSNERIITKEPIYQSPEYLATLNLARYHENKNEKKSALDYYKRALEIHASGAILSSISRLHTPDNLEEALSFIDSAIQLENDNIYYQYQKADILRLLHRYSEAQPYFYNFLQQLWTQKDNGDPYEAMFRIITCHYLLICNSFILNEVNQKQQQQKQHLLNLNQKDNINIDLVKMKPQDVQQLLDKSRLLLDYFKSIENNNNNQQLLDILIKGLSVIEISCQDSIMIHQYGQEQNPTFKPIDQKFYDFVESISKNYFI